MRTKHTEIIHSAAIPSNSSVSFTIPKVPGRSILANTFRLRADITYDNNFIVINPLEFYAIISKIDIKIGSTTVYSLDYANWYNVYKKYWASNKEVRKRAFEYDNRYSYLSRFGEFKKPDTYPSADIRDDVIDKIFPSHTDAGQLKGMKFIAGQDLSSLSGDTPKYIIHRSINPNVYKTRHFEFDFELFRHDFSPSTIDDITITITRTGFVLSRDYRVFTNLVMTFDTDDYVSDVSNVEYFYDMPRYLTDYDDGDKIIATTIDNARSILLLFEESKPQRLVLIHYSTEPLKYECEYSIKIDGKQSYGVLKYDDLYYEACRHFNNDDPYLDAHSFYYLHPAVVFNLDSTNIKQYITISSKNTGYKEFTNNIQNQVSGLTGVHHKRLFAIAPARLSIKNGSVYDIK